MGRAVTRGVFDSSVIVAGSCWRGESYLCLVSFARRRLRAFTSAWILEETRRAIRRLQSESTGFAHDPWPIFQWFSDRAQLLSPTATGRRRSRGPADDPVLGTGLAARANVIISLDRDLLDLEKPFGIEILRPSQLLAKLQRPI